MSFDESLLRAIVSLRSPVLDVLFGAVWIATISDLAWFALAAFALRRGRRGLWVSLAVLLGLAIAWLAIDGVLKPLVARPRPFTTLSDITVLLGPAPRTFSFPSGDVGAAAATAMAFGRQRRRWLPWLVFATLLVAVERIYLGVHYPTDVLGGAIVGGLAGWVAVWLVGAIRTRLPWRAFLVPHTHWDREWYETLAGYRPRLVATVDGVVAELERPGGVDRFTFDGQTIALEDYLGDRPEMRSRVDALVASGRLAVGPWYVLSDLILVHAESTLRNLEEGMRISASHGRAMRVAYVADPFGHPAQMPQILRGFGYGTYVFARGLGDEGEDLGAEFEWEAPSGDRVLALHLVGHYDSALYLVRDPETVTTADADVRRRVRRILPRLLRGATAYAHSDVLMLLVGTDHAPITPELLPAVVEMRAARPRLRVAITTLEDAVAALPPMRLPAHAGEMVAGRYRPILRGVNSTRMWIKQENAACERLLLRWLEPFAALRGRATRDDLRPLWRTLLQCHPHDSICGCSIDEVHEVDMRARFAAVRSAGEALRARLLDDEGAPVAWSSLPFACGRVVEGEGARAFARWSGIGAATLDAVPDRPVASPAPGVLDNGRLRVEVAEDGSFFVAGPGGRTGPHNVLLDEGDRGDEYTYSFAGPAVSSAGTRGARETACDALRGEVRVRYALRVPARVREDRRARSEEEASLDVETVVSLDAEAERVDVRTTVANRARDHRLRAVFATGRAARTHLAAEQFAWVRRPNRVAPRSGWSEQPPDTAHAQDLVAVADAAGGIVVAGDGLPEYGVLDDGRRVALTLFRAVGWLSRGDLRERPGHAGPAIETPAAELQGTLASRYCLVPLASIDDLPRAARAVRAFLEPPLVGRGRARTLLTIETEGAAELSALRPGTAAGTIVLRLANPSGAPATARVRAGVELAPVRATDLREGVDDLGATGAPVVRTAAPLEERDGALEAHLAPYEIGTWVVRASSG